MILFKPRCDLADSAMRPRRLHDALMPSRRTRAPNPLDCLSFVGLLHPDLHGRIVSAVAELFLIVASGACIDALHRPFAGPSHAQKPWQVRLQFMGMGWANGCAIQSKSARD